MSGTPEHPERPRRPPKPPPGPDESAWEVPLEPQPADMEPEPLYAAEGSEPVIAPEDLTTEELGDADLLGMAGTIDLEAGGGPPGETGSQTVSVRPELEPEPEPAAYEEAAVRVAPGVAAGRRAPASRKIRDQAQRELGQLWGSIFFAVERPPPRIVAVTSAMRREGVTQIATALAMAGAAAHADLKIALVDCNLRHPRIAELLELPPAPGVSDVIAGRTTLEQAVHILSLEEGGHDLYVLTAGTEDPQPLGLLRSRQLRALLAGLSECFDHVVLDVAAINLYPDPHIVGGMVEGTLLVVQSGRTRRESVAEAKKRLDLAQARLMGVVLNQRTYPIPGFIYRNL